MQTLEEKLIEFHEGRRNIRYLCPAGFETIGVGHNLEASPLTDGQVDVVLGDAVSESESRDTLLERALEGGISNEAVDRIFEDDLAKVRDQLDIKLPWWRQLSEVRQAVLLDMAFNMGIGGLLKFRQTLEHFRVGRYTLASGEMLNSLWAQQVPTRAHRLSEMVASDAWPQEITT